MFAVFLLLHLDLFFRIWNILQDVCLHFTHSYIHQQSDVYQKDNWVKDVCSRTNKDETILWTINISLGYEYCCLDRTLVYMLQSEKRAREKRKRTIFVNLALFFLASFIYYYETKIGSAHKINYLTLCEFCKYEPYIYYFCASITKKEFLVEFISFVSFIFI